MTTRFDYTERPPRAASASTSPPERGGDLLGAFGLCSPVEEAEASSPPGSGRREERAHGAGGPHPERMGTQASVVMATLGRAAQLPTIVDAVLRDPGTLELIVVVDGPDDHSMETLRALSVTRKRLRPLQVPHGGHLAALDEGVRIATGDVVVLLDDDVLPDPGTIASHAAHHAARPGLVVAGPMPVAVDGRVQSFATRLYAVEYEQHIRAIEHGSLGVLDALWAGNLSLRTEDCRRVGLYDPAFRVYYHTDRHLGYRLAAAGLIGHFDPTLTARHLHRRSDRQFLADAQRQGEGRVELHRLHPGRHGPFQLHSLVSDLPRGLQLVVAACGSSRAAEATALCLMWAGSRWERRLPSIGNPIVTAKVARRIMQWHGARLAQWEPATEATPLSPARAGTVPSDAC